VTALTSRLAEDQPGQFVGEMPVSGRSYLREAPLPADFQHDVRFQGASYGPGLRVYCEPCDWRTYIDAGHSLTDLIRLVAMHSGVPDVTITTTEALMELLKPEVTP
jgi:hypothetical protein